MRCLLPIITCKLKPVLRINRPIQHHFFPKTLISFSSSVQNNYKMTSEEKVLKSRYRDLTLDYSCGSVVEYLLKGAEENTKIGRKNWLTNGLTGESLTFQDVGPMSRKVAWALQNHGFLQGDTVLYLTSDVARIYTIVLGIWKLGGVVFSSYPDDKKEILSMRMKDAKVKWVVCDSKGVEQVMGAVAEVTWKVEVFCFDPPDTDSYPNLHSVDSLFAQEPPKDYEVSKLEVSLDDPILILCTSGTTGLSKGAIHTHRSLLSLMHLTSLIPFVDKPELFILKCIHVLGMSFPMRNLKSGNWAIMLPQISKKSILEAVHKYKPRLAFGLPPHLNYLVSSDLDVMAYDRSSLEFMVTGGIVVHQKFFDAIYKHIPSVRGIVNGLGMTECGVLTTTVDLDSSDGSYRTVDNVPPLSVGLLYPNSELKVLDLDSGATLGHGQKGELVFKTPLCSVGYINRPEETKKTFQDGWIRTGDFGLYDENGFVFIVDRIKETFLYDGHRVSPSELEEVISDHPAVLECSVFGVPDPKSKKNTIPRAGVSLREGVSASAEEIQRFVNDRVESFMELRGGVFILPAPLPRGDTGKISRITIASIIEKKQKGGK